MTSQLNELLTFQRSALPLVKSPDPPSPREILEVMRGCWGLGTRQLFQATNHIPIIAHHH